MECLVHAARNSRNGMNARTNKHETDNTPCSKTAHKRQFFVDVYVNKTHQQWRRHGGCKRGQLPPTLSGVDLEISANPVRNLER